MNHETLTQLIEQWLDQTIAEQNLIILKQELVSNPEATELYVDMAETHSLLQQSRSNSSSAPKNVVPINEILRRQKRRSLKIASMAAAAIVLITLVSMNLLFIDKPASSLVFETSPGTAFTLTHAEKENAPTGATLLTGSRLQLEQGSVELTFDSGVKSIVLAPADLTLHAADQLFLNHGSAWFDVPKNAIGFTVKTNELEVIDLGTQFGVYSNKNDYDEVHTFNGSVLVNSLGLSGQTVTLHAGEARQTNTIGNLVSIPAKHSAFLTALPTSLPHIHWSFEEDLQASGSHPDAATIETFPPSTLQTPLNLLKPNTKGKHLALDGKQQHLTTNWKGFSNDRSLSTSFWMKVSPGNRQGGFSGIIGWGSTLKSYSKWTIVAKTSKFDGQTNIALTVGNRKLIAMTPIPSDEWHHIAVVYESAQQSETDSGHVKIYIDGMLSPINGYPDATIPPLSISPHSTDSKSLRIGQAIRRHKASDHGLYFKGELDDIYLFDGKLSEKKIQQLSLSPPSSSK